LLIRNVDITIKSLSFPQDDLPDDARLYVQVVSGGVIVKQTTAVEKVPEEPLWKLTGVVKVCVFQSPAQ
jgi:hypothetical protein